MESIHQISKRYDAMKPASYLDTYAALLDSKRLERLRILELGVHKAGSMNMWLHYLPNSQVIGIDINPKPLDFPDDPRASFIQGSQSDHRVLSAACSHGPFDLIIDDAAHLGRLAKASFCYLFRDHLKPNGVYVLEDWGAALSMPEWPDKAPYDEQQDSDTRFPSYDFGMVGLLKQIIDQSVVARSDFGGIRPGKIHIQNGLALIEKRTPGTSSYLVSRMEP